jgi:hypothetical protein
MTTLLPDGVALRGFDYSFSSWFCGPNLIIAITARRPLLLGLPDDQLILVCGVDVNGERSESAGHEAPLTSASKTK